MSEEISKEEQEALSREVDRILIELDEMGKSPLLDCTNCNGELTLRMETAPTGPGGRLEVTALGYNCAYCLAMNVVWKRDL